MNTGPDPMPLVDIVLRTKNRPLFLTRALDDVLAQDYPHWHLIIVNDGGDADPIRARLSQLPELTARVTHTAGPETPHPPEPQARVTLVDLPESMGRGAAAVRGIHAGSAPLISIHDDDDTWHPHFLSRTVEHLRDSDDIAVAVRTQIVWEHLVAGQFQETGREIFHPHMQEPTYFDLLRFNHVVPISLLYRRSVHDTIAIDERLRSVFDWDFNMKLWQAGTVSFLDGEPLAFWHQRRTTLGDAANSVHGEPDSHILHDRRVRDEALREYVTAHGSGDLLYLSKYVDERTGEFFSRADRIEAQLDEALSLVRASKRQRTRRP